MFDLAFIWAGLIAFAVLAYVLLDGFDLGVGILFPFLADEHERDAGMNSVAPVWDGNETWLVLGGGGLLAVFPLAYAVVLPALYAPIIAMLLGLIFRGVAFEFRWRTQRGKCLWDWAFAGGSIAGRLRPGHRARRAGPGHPGRRPRLCRRLVGLADLVQPAHRRRAGRRLCAARRHLADPEDHGAAAGAAPTASPGHRRSRTLALIGVVSLWTPFLDPVFMQRWFAWPRHPLPAPVPIFVALAALVLFGGLYQRREVHAVPRGHRAVRAVLHRPRHQLLSLHRAAARSRSGRPPRPTPASASCWSAPSVLIPLILAYTAWSYWVFRGKVDTERRLSLMPARPAGSAPLAAPPAVVRRPVAGRRRRGRRCSPC